MTDDTVVQITRTDTSTDWIMPNNKVSPIVKDKIKSSPPAREDWFQVLGVINQIGQTLTTSLHTMDLQAICRSILYNLQWKNLFHYDIAEICLWDTHTKILTSILQLPENNGSHPQEQIYHLQEGYTGWIAAQQKPLVIQDTHQWFDILPKDGLELFPYHSYIGVPLKVGLKFVGTLELAATSLNIYNENDITILEIIANQAAITIDHIRLFQETQRNVSELALLFDASNELSSTLSYQELLQNLSRQMLNAFPADQCLIFSFDEATGTLTLLYNHTLAETLEEPTAINREAQVRSMTELKVWEAACYARTPLILRSDQVPHDDADLQEWLATLDRGAAVALPLFNRDHITGILVLYSPDPNDFTEYQVQLAQSLANQANIALDNARLFSLTDQQLQNRINELAGLQRVSRESNSTLDLDKILNLILDEAMRVTQADFGNINLYDARTGILVAHKEQGEQAPSTIQQESNINLLEQVIHTGKPILVDDVLEEHGIQLGKGNQTRSLVVIPIYYGGEPAGVINLESQRPNFFNKNQLRYLEALANQAAVAIGNAQAYEEQKREREQASRRVEQLSRLSEISNAFRTNRPLAEVLDDIAYAILESVGYKVVLISLVNQDQLIMHQVGAGIPRPEFEAWQTEAQPQPVSALSDVMQDRFKIGRSYFVPADQKEVWQNKLKFPYVGQHHDLVSSKTKEELNDPWQVGDLLFVPLRDTDEKIIGLLTVEEPDNGERPQDAAFQTLEIFANQAATAIENARLFELERQRRHLADTLRGVAEAISSQLDFDELLNIVLQELSNVVQFDSASVQRLQGNEIIIVGGHGWEDSQPIIGLSFSMEGINPNRLVIESQEPLIINNVLTAYPDTFGPPHKDIKSWLGVPLTYGANILGLMSLDSAEENFFSQEDATVTLAFANQVAVAMQNATLFENVRDQVRRLATLTDVAQALNRALDLSEILDLVLDAVFELIDNTQGTIWLIDKKSDTLQLANTKNIPAIMVELFNESAMSITEEPFSSVIQSGDIQIVAGNQTKNALLAGYVSSQPNDVTYVPLKTEDGVIGLLALEAVLHDKNMLDLVSTLASLAAIAIDNAQLVQRLNLLTEELEQRVEERTEELARTLHDLTEERDRFETLYQITKELSTSFDLDRILTQALNLINQAVGISHGSILLLDRNTGKLIYRTALGNKKSLPRGGYETNYNVGHGLAGKVMQTRELLIIPDLLNEPDWVPTKKTPDRRSAIAAPLMAGEEVVGIVMLFHHEVNYFVEKHAKLVEAAGTQMANAINNAELYRLITDQAKRLGGLLRSQAAEAEKNEAILQGITDGVLVLDANRHVVLLNPTGAEILEIDAKTLQNQPFAEILEHSHSSETKELTQRFYDEFVEALPKIRSGEASADFRIETTDKAIVVTLASLALAAEELPSVVAVIRDISREAEIDRIRNEFISTVSHELRTPMTSIKGYSDLLMSGNAQIGELNPTQHRFVEVIQSNANRLTGLVNDILEISRIETGRIHLDLEFVNLDATIEEVVASFEGQLVQKLVNLQVNLADNLPPVWVDKNRLVQILVNLIGNAWQYTPEGGDIMVQANLAPDNFVQVDVIDSGIGIVQKDLDLIFDRFFRSERTEVQVVDGTGLGLSITKSFVDMLNGQIWVESELDVGSTFSFTIPTTKLDDRET